jgi:hypothetical protein
MSPLLKLLCWSASKYKQRLYSKKKHGVPAPMLELTITSTYLKIDFEVQLSTPTTTNAGECFLIIQKLNNQKEKGQYREGEERGGS